HRPIPGGVWPAGGEEHIDGLTHAGLLGAVDDATTAGVHGDPVATFECLLGGERAEPNPAALQPGGSLPQSATRQGNQPLAQTVLPQPASLDTLGDHLPAPRQPPAALLERPFALPEDLARIPLAQHPLQVAQAIAPPRVEIEGEAIERLAAPLQLVRGGDQGGEPGTLQPLPTLVQLPEQVTLVGHDDLGRSRGGTGL